MFWKRLITGCISCLAYWMVAAQPPTTVQLLRGPYLQVGTSTSMTIRWRTDVATRSRVRFGTDTSLSQMLTDSSLLTEHSITLTGLQPLTRYYYAIETFKDRLQGDADNYFYTLPVAGEKGVYRIGALGDCGNNSVNQRNVKAQLLQYLDGKYMNACLLLGDNAYSSGTDAEYQANFFNIYKDDVLKHYPLYPSPGNHDYNDRDFPGAVLHAMKTHETSYYNNFTMPAEGEAGGIPSHTEAFYSFDVGNIHFLSLDSYGLEEDQYKMCDTLGPQAQWVKKDLEANRGKDWVIAYWHHPPYTMGSHNSDTEEDLVAIRENFIRILERYGVDLVICGHSHDYERSRLMQGHYGMEATFDSTVHDLSVSSGVYDGSSNACPYIKDSANQGTVYVVTGSAGKLGGKQPGYPHNAMQYANADQGGASLLEVQGNRLDFTWICADGVVRDHFTMMKKVNQQTTYRVKKGEPVTLTASFVGDYQWDHKLGTAASVTIKPGKGTHTFQVKDTQGCVQDEFTVVVTK